MSDTSREALVGHIEHRLRTELSTLRAAFRAVADDVPTRASSIPGLLPADVAQHLYESFPPVTSMRRMSSLRERKYTFKQLSDCSRIVEDATFAFQDARIVRLVEEITGMRELVPDARLYAGGISSMVKGDYLHPHIDNSHDSERRLYRRINLLYYVTPEWKLENGGNLHLWDSRVRRFQVLPSAFNTLVLMETNRASWHSVDRVLADGPRCCVSNYYFSPRSPDGTEYFHITDFTAPPEMPIRRLITRIDGRLRTAVRALKGSGLSRRDFYR
jgi:Rps23 Pro-64 3,4-dihydroxylase Tpa1-like proline 4-hydroxylase